MVTRFKSVFRTLATGMVAMGVVVGALFPLLAIQLGVSRAHALSPIFIGTTITAGFLVGILNYALASRIVRPKLRRLADGMRQTRRAMEQATFTGDWSACDPTDCQLNEQGADELGEVAGSYNALLQALYDAHLIEDRIQKFNNTLSSQLDLKDLCEEALGLLQAHIGADGGSVVLERQGELTVISAHGLINPEKILQSPVLQAASDLNEQRHIKLPESVRLDAVVTHFNPTDVLLVPIKHHGLRLGWVVLASSTAFSEHSKRFMPLLTQGLGLALNNALLHADLQRVAALDPLTGLYNRRFGMARLEEELELAQRDHKPLALLMIDLDHFKRINDTYGHLTGDRVLIHAAKTCRDLLRKGDILIRYGGEEFIAILIGSDIGNAKDTAERIRFAIKQAHIALGDHTLSLSVSIGVAANSEAPAFTPEAFLKLADQRLYAAKGAGRDRVVAKGSGGMRDSERIPKTLQQSPTASLDIQ